MNRVEKEEEREGGVLWVTVWADLVMGGVEEVFQISWLLINRGKKKTAEDDEKDTGKKKKISKPLEEWRIGGVWDGSTSPSLVPNQIWFSV